MSLRSLALAYLESQKKPHAAVGNVPSVPTVPTRTRGTSGTFNWVLLQTEADKRNINAQHNRLTDRYCRCGRLAEYAWPLDRRREIWRCNWCLDTSGKA